MKRFAGAVVPIFYIAGAVILLCYIVKSESLIASASASPPDGHIQPLKAERTATPQKAAVRSGPGRSSAAVGPRWRSKVGDDLESELHCLALNIYFEARSEPRIGMLAVAAVTLNRVSHPAFPKSICQVIWQGEELGQHRCQFSWACDGQSDEPREVRAWKAAQNVARSVLSYDLADPTAGALWYHADYVEPTWARSKIVVARIGRHIYYRNPLSAELSRPGAS